MLRYLIIYLYKKKSGKKFDLKIARYRGLPYSGWTYQSETSLLSSLQGWVRNIRDVTYMVFDTSKTTYFTSWVFDVMYFTCRKPHDITAPF